VLLKNFLRALALRQGRCVTFMPRWTEAADSQSIHVHVSLKDHDGTPLFHDPRRRTASARPSGTSSAACRPMSAT
jgi:glutamine synthetase